MPWMLEDRRRRPGRRPATSTSRSSTARRSSGTGAIRPRPRASTPRAILPRGETEVVVMTEAVPLVNHTTWSDTDQYALDFYKLAIDANPRRPGLPLRDLAQPRQRHRRRRALRRRATPCPGASGSTRICRAGRRIVDHVNAHRDPGAAGDADRAGRTGAGAAARRDRGGRACPAWPTSAQLFRDDIHPNDLGNYFVAMVQYATLYGRDPRGPAARIANEWGGSLDAPVAGARPRHAGDRLASGHRLCPGRGSPAARARGRPGRRGRGVELRVIASRSRAAVNEDCYPLNAQGGCP